MSSGIKNSENDCQNNQANDNIEGYSKENPKKDTSNNNNKSENEAINNENQVENIKGNIDDSSNENNDKNQGINKYLMSNDNKASNNEKNKEEQTIMSRDEDNPFFKGENKDINITNNNDKENQKEINNEVKHSQSGNEGNNIDSNNTAKYSQKLEENKNISKLENKAEQENNINNNNKKTLLKAQNLFPQNCNNSYLMNRNNNPNENNKFKEGNNINDNNQREDMINYNNPNNVVQNGENYQNQNNFNNFNGNNLMSINNGQNYNKNNTEHNNNDHNNNVNNNNNYINNNYGNNNNMPNNNDNNYNNNNINNKNEDDANIYPLSQYKEVSRTGLENYGDISYLNAVLQSIGQIKDFANYFLRKDKQKEIESNIRDMPLSFVTERLFIHLYPFPRKPSIEIYKLSSYLRVLKSINCLYKTDQRRDVIELLIFILNTLHNELGGDNKGSIISETVAFSFRNQISCCNCGNSSYRTMTFNTFDLDISKTYEYFKKEINIYDCLNFWKNNNYLNLYCYKCGNFACWNKISNIESAPKVFIFLLQRKIIFDQDNINLRINFIIDEKIDLSQYIQGGVANRYELTGIVSIYVEEKKYISYCKSPIDDLWYRFNDIKVECLSLKDIINQSKVQRTIPCILYYTKN